MATPKKPTTAKLLAGTFRSDRDVAPSNAPRVQAFAEAPPPPIALEGVAVLVWQDIAPRLVAAGVLKPTDLYALEMFCKAVQDERECGEVVKEHGHLIPGSTGSLVANPAVSMRAKAREQVRQFGMRFGLDPASFNGLGMASAAPRDSLLDGLMPKRRT